MEPAASWREEVGWGHLAAPPPCEGPGVPDVHVGEHAAAAGPRGHALLPPLDAARTPPGTPGLVGTPGNYSFSIKPRHFLLGKLDLLLSIVTDVCIVLASGSQISVF